MCQNKTKFILVNTLCPQPTIVGVLNTEMEEQENRFLHEPQLRDNAHDEWLSEKKHILFSYKQLLSVDAATDWLFIYKD